MQIVPDIDLILLWVNISNVYTIIIAQVGLYLYRVYSIYIYNRQYMYIVQYTMYTVYFTLYNYL